MFDNARDCVGARSDPVARDLDFVGQFEASTLDGHLGRRAQGQAVRSNCVGNLVVESDDASALFGA